MPTAPFQYSLRVGHTTLCAPGPQAGRKAHPQPSPRQLGYQSLLAPKLPGLTAGARQPSCMISTYLAVLSVESRWGSYYNSSWPGSETFLVLVTLFLGENSGPPQTRGRGSRTPGLRWNDTRQIDEQTRTPGIEKLNISVYCIV